MRNTSIRELHIHTSALVQEASDGVLMGLRPTERNEDADGQCSGINDLDRVFNRAVIIIERRGQPVAELRPLSGPVAISSAVKRKLFSRIEKFWATRPELPIDSTRIIEEDRDR